MIVFGLRMYGWVDEVEGVGTVTTRFFHIMFIPLIPIGGAFMIDSDKGFDMEMSLKSVVVAYIRAMLFWSAFGMFVAVPASMGASLCLAIPLAIAYFAMPFLVRKASPERAAELKARFLRGS